MKKYLLSMMVPVLMLIMQGGAFAGERAGAFSVSPFAGMYNFESDQNTVTGSGYDLRENRGTAGLRLGYDFTDNFASELVGSYIHGKQESVSENVNIYSYHLDLLYNFMPLSRVVPYVAVGGGAITYNYAGKDNSDTDGAFNTGVGLKLFVTESIALRADGRYILAFGDRAHDNWEYTGGLTFVFGGSKPAAAAATGGMIEEQPQEQPQAQPMEQPKEAPLEPVPAAEPAPGHFKYCVTLHTEFDIDRDLIRPEYKDEVAKVGDFMRKYPTTTAVIEGHTDNVGDAQHNMELSQRRAQAVVDFLVQNYGIDRSRLSAKGFGSTQPVADNATNEGKQKNRRIEAIIDCTFEMKEVTPPERLCVSLVMDFDAGKSTIKPEYRNEIAKVADYMKRYPTTTALIEGHTDNVGGYDANMQLSQQRAEAVVNYLVQNFGIDRSRLAAKGYGYTRRIAYNDTAEGRAKNRRINAVIDCVVNP